MDGVLFVFRSGPLTDVESLVMVIKGEAWYVPGPEGGDETVWDSTIVPPPTLYTITDWNTTTSYHRRARNDPENQGDQADREH